MSGILQDSENTFGILSENGRKMDEKLFKLSQDLKNERAKNQELRSQNTKLAAELKTERRISDEEKRTSENRAKNSIGNREEIFLLQKENEKLKKELKEGKTFEEQLMKESNRLHAEVEKLKRGNSAKTSKTNHCLSNSELEQDIKILTLERTDFLSKIEKLQSDLQTVKKEKQKLETQIGNGIGNNSPQLDVARVPQVNSKNSKQNTRQSIAGGVAELQRDIDILTLEKKDLLTRIDNFQKELTNVKKDREKLESELRSDIANNTTVHGNTELENLRSTLSKSEEIITERDQEIKDLRSKIEELWSSRDKLEKELEVERAASQKRSTELEEKMTQMTKEMQRTQDEKMILSSHLTKTEHKLKKDLNDNKTLLNKLREDIRKIKESKRTEIGNLQSEHESVRIKMAEEIAELNISIKELKKELELAEERAAHDIRSTVQETNTVGIAHSPDGPPKRTSPERAHGVDDDQHALSQTSTFAQTPTFNDSLIKKEPNSENLESVDETATTQEWNVATAQSLDVHLPVSTEEDGADEEVVSVPPPKKRGRKPGTRNKKARRRASRAHTPTMSPIQEEEAGEELQSPSPRKSPRTSAQDDTPSPARTSDEELPSRRSSRTPRPIKPWDPAEEESQSARKNNLKSNSKISSPPPAIEDGASETDLRSPKKRGRKPGQKASSSPLPETPKSSSQNGPPDSGSHTDAPRRRSNRKKRKQSPESKIPEETSENEPQGTEVTQMTESAPSPRKSRRKNTKGNVETTEPEANESKKKPAAKSRKKKTIDTDLESKVGNMSPEAKTRTRKKVSFEIDDPISNLEEATASTEKNEHSDEEKSPARPDVAPATAGSRRKKTQRSRKILTEDVDQIPDNDTTKNSPAKNKKATKNAPQAQKSSKTTRSRRKGAKTSEKDTEAQDGDTLEKGMENMEKDPTNTALDNRTTSPNADDPTDDNATSLKRSRSSRSKKAPNSAKMESPETSLPVDVKKEADADPSPAVKRRGRPPGRKRKQ